MVRACFSCPLFSVFSRICLRLRFVFTCTCEEAPSQMSTLSLNHKSRIEAESLVEGVIGMIQLHPHNAAVLQTACGVIISLCANTNNRSCFVRMGCHNLLMEAVEEFSRGDGGDGGDGAGTSTDPTFVETILEAFHAVTRHQQSRFLNWR